MDDEDMPPFAAVIVNEIAYLGDGEDTTISYTVGDLIDLVYPGLHEEGSSVDLWVWSGLFETNGRSYYYGIKEDASPIFDDLVKGCG